MAKTAQAALATDEILFELDRFELVDGRLTLSGRWFGVRGRRFVRPTLTPLGGRDVSRVLADLEHKPWAAEDGEPWEAAFPWDRPRAGAKFELSVAPDIVIRLPSPSAKLILPRRFPALPREPSIVPVWRQPQVEERTPPSPPPGEVEPSRDEVLAPELTVARTAELEATRVELESTGAELASTRVELASTGAELATTRAELESTRAELATTNNQLAELKTAFDELARERDQATADERTVGELRSELERTAAALEEAALERDEAIRAHGAAMVMRRATRAAPYPTGRRGSWWALVPVPALVAVVVVVLIVVHVL